MKKISLTFAALGLLFMASCGGGKEKETSSYDENDYSTYRVESDEESYDSQDEEPAEEANQDQWNPVGEYSMEDADGLKYILTVKKGGSAELFQKAYEGLDDYEPAKGSWTKGSDGKSINLDFFSGPFIHIASHDYVSNPVLTSEYFYYNRSAYNDDTDCLEVKKID